MIDPRHMELQEWADFMVHDLRQYGAVPILQGEDWKGWAQLVIELPGVAELKPPQPEGFSTWRDWADQFNRVVTS